MSQELLGQTLHVLIICKEGEVRSFLEQVIQTLGHTVLATIVASKAQKVVNECLKLPAVPHLVLCDITAGDLLDRIYTVFSERKVLVPFIIITEQTAEREIFNCASRDYVMGCYYKAVVTQDQLALAVLVAVKKFATLMEYAQATEQALEKLAQRKAIEKAKGYLMSMRGLNEDQAHHYLEKLAAQHQIVLYEQALRVIAAYGEVTLSTK